MGKSKGKKKSANHVRHSRQASRPSGYSQPKRPVQTEQNAPKRRIFPEVFRWSVIFACGSMILTAGLSLSSVLLAAVIILLLPFVPIWNLWEKVLHGKRWLKPVILILMFFIAVILSPANTAKTPAANPSPTPTAAVTAEADPAAEATIVPQNTKAPASAE